MFPWPVCGTDCMPCGVTALQCPIRPGPRCLSGPSSCVKWGKRKWGSGKLCETGNKTCLSSLSPGPLGQEKFIFFVYKLPKNRQELVGPGTRVWKEREGKGSQEVSRQPRPEGGLSVVCGGLV